YKKYLDEYTEVSRLKIAGGYVYDEVSSTGTDDKSLVLFGRTKINPLRYYYRFANFENGDSSGASWEPWKKVDVAIESERVYPVYAFNRVFVFWSTVERIADEDDEQDASTAAVANTTDESEDDVQYFTSSPSGSSSRGGSKRRVNIYFSFYNLNDEWSQPQLLDTNIETSGKITNVELFVENAEKIDGYDEDDHENIVVSCKYTYYDFSIITFLNFLRRKYTASSLVKTSQKSYSLTSELVTYDASTPEFGNKGLEVFRHLFPNENYNQLDSDDIVMLNSSENSTDGPWFAYDFKGGGFMVKPDVTPLTSDKWPQSLSTNSVNLPTTESAITAAFYDGTNTYYMVGTQYFIYNGDETTITKLDNTSKWGVARNNILDNMGVDAGYKDDDDIYLFSGNEYYHYEADSDVATEGYPKLLASNDLGIPTDWGLVNAAFKGDDGTVYFFNNSSGGRYVGKGGSENTISSKWGMFSNNFISSGSLPVVASFVYEDTLYAFNDAQWARYDLSLDTSTNEMVASLSAIKWGDLKDFLVEEFGFEESDLLSYTGKTAISAGMYGEHILSVYIDGSSENKDAFDLQNKQKAAETIFGAYAQYFNDNDAVFSYFVEDPDTKEMVDIRIFTDGSDKDSFLLRKHTEYIGSNFTIQDPDGNNLLLDAAFVYNDIAYLLCGDVYWMLDVNDISLSDPQTLTVKDVGSNPITDILDFGVTLDSVDAAFVANDYTYLVSGKSYLRYKEDEYNNAESFGQIANLIPGLPDGTSSSDNWYHTIDAAFPYTDGDYYIFNTLKNQCLRLAAADFDTYDKETITVDWGHINPSNFDASTIDAAYVRDNKAYLFSGSRFIVHPITNGEVDEYIEGTSLEIANNISEVSAAFVLDGIAYLISGSQYYRIESGETPDSFAHTGDAIKGSWGNLPSDLNSGITAALNKDDNLYLFQDAQFIDYEISDVTAYLYEISRVNFEIIRLTTSTADALNQALLSSVDTPTGIGGLLNATVQQTDETPSFSRDGGSAPTVIEADGTYVTASDLPISSHLDFNSANGIYYWEIFFHAPFHIAMSLNADQKFDDAREWYEYIFDPTESSDYWKFLPFLATDIRALVTSMEENLSYFDDADATDKLTALSDLLMEYNEVFRGFMSIDNVNLGTDAVTGVDMTLSNIESWTVYTNFSDAIEALTTTDAMDPDKQTLLETAQTNLQEVMEICARLRYRYDLMNNTVTQVNTYLEDPFDPHTIAEYRKIAYRKAIVMNYIDNLLDWGDMLFRQYTRESINEARMLYVLAYDLLGKKPENLGEKVLPDDVAYAELRHFTDNEKEDYDFIFDLENANYDLSEDAITDTYDSFSFAGNVNDSISNPYFFVPENTQFIDYWDRVEDRLHKIRNSMNIMGIKQPLALFQPPIDPAALVNAVAGGGGIEGAMAGMAMEVPHYRFGYMLNKAKEFAQGVEQFGNELLAAIEKRDAEALSILQNNNEYSILDLTTQIKKKQIEDSQKNIESLEQSKKNAESQRDHYQLLLDEDWLDEENKQVDLMQDGVALQSTAAAGYLISAGLRVIPQNNLGPFIVGVTTGGTQLSEFLEGVNESFQTVGEALMTSGELSGIRAQHERTKQDWTLQRDMALGEISQLEIQIDSAKLQKEIADRELVVHKKDIENNRSMTTFMMEKFSNKALYQWMAGKLSSMYYDSYKMAHDMAKQAEKAFQFETGTKETEVSYIGGAYWNSQKKGLLAGTSLSFDLSRMEKAYMEQDVRTMEVTKNISLLELDPMAFMELKAKGVCEFRLTEALFDYDFPGHFKRQVKNISLAFNVGEGKYVNATLTQLNNKVILEPDIKAVKYLLDAKGTQPVSIRNDWKANQQVALSYVDQYSENNGIFELRYWDDRYLPFEGTGAVSLWRLELNGKQGFNYNTADLLDVTIKLRYTANQGGTAFANAVKGSLKPYQTTSFFDIGYNFADQWNQFQVGDSDELELTFTRDMFPSMAGGKLNGLFLKYDYEGDQKPTFLLNDDTQLPDGIYLEIGNLNVAKEGSAWTFTVQGDKSMIRNVEMIALYKAKV
ncbi:MAG: neuraminidase-like domain-containing protein, partial [Bacteroidota bacterium]